MLFELFKRREGIRVGSISDDVALVGAVNRVENLGMDAGIVIAGEAAPGLNRELRHGEQFNRVSRVVRDSGDLGTSSLNFGFRWFSESMVLRISI